MNHRILPPGYRYAGTLDFMRDRNRIKALLILSLALIVVPVIVGLLTVPVGPSWHLLASKWTMWPCLGLALILYIPLHELVHGIAMFALSGVKPTYGLKLPYAYAGSTVWFDKKSHIITALAPVVLWGIVLQYAIARLPQAWFWPLWIIQISNLSGSAGDLYTVWALARMKGDLLIQDTGVRMRIMRRTIDTERSHE